MKKQERRNRKNLKKCESARKAGKESLLLKLFTRDEISHIEESGFSVFPTSIGLPWREVLL